MLDFLFIVRHILVSNSHVVLCVFIGLLFVERFLTVVGILGGTGKIKIDYPTTDSVKKINKIKPLDLKLADLEMKNRQENRPPKLQSLNEIPQSNSTPSLPEILTRENVATHVCSNDLWIIINKRVFDITRWSKEHPGGSLQRYGGKDLTEVFMSNSTHTSDSNRKRMRNLFKQSYIGNIGTRRKLSKRLLWW